MATQTGLANRNPKRLVLFRSAISPGFSGVNPSLLIEAVSNDALDRIQIAESIFWAAPRECEAGQLIRSENFVRAGSVRMKCAESVGMIDELLLKAINQGIDQRSKTIAQVCTGNPEWTAEAVEKRMEELATQQVPACYRKGFWTAEMDQILIAGARGGLESARKAVRKILAVAPELRLQTIQQRQRALVRRVPAGKSRRSRRYNWTADLDARLRKAYDQAGIGVAVTEMNKLTGWPRAAIYRRCHKLGIPKEQNRKLRRWSAVDWKYASDRLNHAPIAAIAKALHRSVKSVRRKVENEGYTVRLEDDYTVSRLAGELHVRRQRIRQWIQEGKLKRGRNRRIKESVIRQFLKEYGQMFDPGLLEPDMRLLLLECRSKPEGRGQ